MVAAVAMMSTIATVTTPPMMATVLELSEPPRVGSGGVVTDTSPSVAAGPAGSEESNTNHGTDLGVTNSTAY